MNKGILDDIITQVNSMKYVPLYWMPPYTIVQPVQGIQQIPIQNTTFSAYQQPPYQPQPMQQPQYEDYARPAAYLNYSEEIRALHHNLASLPIDDLEAAFTYLVSVTEYLGRQIEQYQSMKPDVELQQSYEYVQQEARANPLLQQIQARKMLNKSYHVEQRYHAVQAPRHIKRFPTDMGHEHWTEALLGTQCQKIQKLTLDAAAKFVWLDKNVKKMFWSASEGYPACGSFSLGNIRYILVGQLSIDFTRGKLSYRDLESIYSSGVKPQTPSISFVNDKRDANIMLLSVDQCDVWAAAAYELEPSIAVIF